MAGFALRLPRRNVMERQDLGPWLADRFTPDHWDRGISKSDLITAAEDDDKLVQLFGQLPDGGLFRGPDEVLQGMPHRGWEDARLPGPLGA